MSDQKIIDHDPDEAPRQRSWYWEKGIYWIAWGAVAFVWIMQVKDGFDWEQIGLGAFTGLVFMASALPIRATRSPTHGEGSRPAVEPPLTSKAFTMARSPGDAV